jgi:hypothetical protein
LNCVSGEWSNQKETIPIALCLTKKVKQLVIEKRDNSSFNSFFAMLNKGMSSAQAISKVESRGHLEPGVVDGFVEELKDLVNKTNIILNISCVILNIAPTRTTIDSNFKLYFSSPEEIAKWHIEGKKIELYRAPHSVIQIDSHNQRISSGIEFDGLGKTNSLAKDFPWKCVHLIQNQSQSGRTGFLGVGYGGAKKTSEKIIWEVIRYIRLRRRLLGLEKMASQPIPVLEELSIGYASAKLLKKELIKRLELRTN